MGAFLALIQLTTSCGDKGWRGSKQGWKTED
jgi:hypothetical protein